MPRVEHQNKWRGDEGRWITDCRSVAAGAVDRSKSSRAPAAHGDTEDPIMQKISYLNKLVDELAKAKKMGTILRK